MCGLRRALPESPAAKPAITRGGRLSRALPGRQLFFLVGRERGDPAQHVGELTVVGRGHLLQVAQYGRQPGRQFRLLFPGGPAGLLSSGHVSLLCPMTP